MDDRKLRLYQFLLDMKRITINDALEPYKSELQGDTHGA